MWSEDNQNINQSLIKKKNLQKLAARLKVETRIQSCYDLNVIASFTSSLSQHTGRGSFLCLVLETN